jgi:hypothetical protein
MRIRFAGAGLLLGGALLAACNGWPRAPELEQVQHKPEFYPSYATTPAEQVQIVAFENRRWLVSPASVALRGVKLVPVGTAAQTTLYAEAGQTAPFSALYAAGGGGKWRRVLPID